MKCVGQQLYFYQAPQTRIAFYFSYVKYLDYPSFHNAFLFSVLLQKANKIALK